MCRDRRRICQANKGAISPPIGDSVGTRNLFTQLSIGNGPKEIDSEFGATLPQHETRGADRAAVKLDSAADCEGRHGLDHCASCRKIVQKRAVTTPPESNQDRQGDFGSDPCSLFPLLKAKRVAGAIVRMISRQISIDRGY